MLEDSILDSVKKVLGIDSSYEVFDQDIIMHINSTFSTLNQLGLGPAAGYMIEDSSDVWDDFISGDIRLNSVKSYIYLRVRLLFDPPQPATLAAFERQIKELEWRLNVQYEDSLSVTITP